MPLQPKVFDTLVALVEKSGHLKHTVVRPSSSVLKYNQPNRDSMAIGRELGVDEPLFDPLRADSRLTDLVRRVGLEM